MERDPLQYGPEYLSDLADRISTDHPADAIAFRQAARNWQEDQKALQVAQDEASRLQQRLNRIASVTREEASCD
jgi:hypothetical protein